MAQRLGSRVFPMVLIVAARSVGAQSATILVTATVVTDRLSAVAVRPLAFASGRRAQSTTVTPTDSTAAQWLLVGQANTTVFTKFTLPAELVNLQAAPATTLPIAFSPRAGRWRREVDDPDGAASFDPREGVAVSFGEGTSPMVYIWLGSTVSPTAAVTPGNYGGTVTLTVFAP